ncbi:unnamed protein product [Mesocestoides corti]|uniref:SUEL-type lectin domain-containing protein n=1 Tax=Mesocestoides corti TaxID=53468 RepID=A0A0R3UGF6_MESCO|nr:unnamed protein product [Mesocestoides corti]
MVSVYLVPALCLGTHSETSFFKVFETLLCSSYRPERGAVKCPAGTQIHLLSAFLGPQAALVKAEGPIPEGVVPCQPPVPSPPKTSSPPHCLKAKDVTQPLKQLCEGKSNCNISPGQFASNETVCRGIASEIFVSYRCEPSPQLVQFRVICRDTYMEIKCPPSHRSEEVLVVLNAQLVKHAEKNTCPEVAEPDSAVGVCAVRMDVTASVVDLCNRERSCSVMPDAAMLPHGYPEVCARRHLQLSYACVPLSVLEDDRKLAGKHVPRHPKLRHCKLKLTASIFSQAHQKKNRREHSALLTPHAPNLPVYQQEQLDPGAYHKLSNSEFERSAYSGYAGESVHVKTSTLTDERTGQVPMKLLPDNMSMFPLILGVIVGLAVLVLLILLLIAIGFRTRRQRAAYAQRKALSDPPNTDTTFSDGDKQPKGPCVQQQPVNGAGNYGYLRPGQQGRDSGAGGVASTYMSHALFATEASWPSGLQPPPTGGNYFDEEQPNVIVSPLGRDSGSQGYIQLPVMSHSCTTTDGLGGTRMCSPAVNSSLSTESDRFSGRASSHPSSFQPLFPTSPNCHRTQTCADKQPGQQMWIGYDGPLTNGDASHLLVPPGGGNDKPHARTGSFESLIEPPESFKNQSQPVEPVDSVPPGMPPLTLDAPSALTQSYSWGWQEPGVSYH